MNYLTIALMASAVFCLRIGGFLLAGTNVPASVESRLRFVPIAVLAALSTSLVSGQADDRSALVAIGVGALSVWFSRRLWVCVIVGLSCYWILDLLGNVW